MYDAFPHPDEKASIRESHRDAKDTLRKLERVELRKLRRLVPESEGPDDDLRLSVTLGAMYNIEFEIPKTSRGSFYMLPDFESPTVIEFFAGAGGMSTGFSNAGFDARGMVEKDPQAAATLKINHLKGKARVYEESVENFLKKAKATIRCYPQPDQVHHINASSPCQNMNIPFVNCNKHTRWWLMFGTLAQRFIRCELEWWSQRRSEQQVGVRVDRLHSTLSARDCFL